MDRNTTGVPPIAVVLLLGALTVCPAQEQAAFTPPGPNIALHKPYTLQPLPTYGDCADPGDATQLTDGVYTEGYFWVQPSTVGWVHSRPVASTRKLPARVYAGSPLARCTTKKPLPSIATSSWFWVLIMSPCVNERVVATLGALRAAAVGTENTMPYILDAVRAYATLGEITDVFREVFGTYEEPTWI